MRKKSHTDGKCRSVMHEMRQDWDCYVYILPFFLIFTVFVIAPVVMSIGLSFTSYNIFEAPRYVGLQNYITFFTADDLSITALKNTLIIAAITGPIGYLLSLLLAWFINELQGFWRTFMVTVFYVPSISGGAYMIFQVLFSGDAYGYLNGVLLELGIINEPIKWLTDTDYMMAVGILVMIWMSLGSGFLSFVAGFRNMDRALYEAGWVEGISNRWQELWFITLPMMKPQLMFGAVMSITGAFSCGAVQDVLFGSPSTEYATHTLVNHMNDYGNTRMEMGYACTIATVLFLMMLLCNKLIQRLLKRVGN